MKDTVEQISGVSINECLQCKKCSSGCPVVSMTGTGPAETIRRLQLDEGYFPFGNNLIWMCVSCETCYERCPMKIDMASVMDALRIIAVRDKKLKQKENVHVFNQSFLKTVKIFGRTYDLGMIGSYKMGTSTFMQDTDKIPVLLGKRKIALFPSFKADKKYVKRIFKKVKDVE